MTVRGLGRLGMRTARFARDHEFFGTAPVVGLAVDDAEAARERLGAAGIELLTELERADGAAWCHFRGPDGNVYEMSRAPPEGAGRAY